jgi:Uma2 family endonuclease
MTVATDDWRFSQGKASPTLETQRRMMLKEFLTYDDGTETRYELEDGVLALMGTESTGNTSIASVELSDPSPLVVIEVVSPGTESTKNYKRDYQWKPRKYADRGVAEFWRVDPEREWVQIGRLRDGQYEFETFKGEEAIVSPTFPELALTAAQVLAAGR